MAAELKPVYLLAGSDRPKITRAVARLRSYFDAAAVETLSANEATGEDAVVACNSLGLFGAGGRLVLVEGVDRWKAADARAVADYLASPAPETVLALIAEEVKKDSPLWKACAKAGDVLAYDVQKRDLPRWVARQFGRLDAKADGAACRALVELVGENLDELAGEVERLATWAAGEEIGEQDVERLVAPRAEAPPWALTDAWGRRDVPAALAACEKELDRSAASSLVWRMADQVRLVRACRRMAEEGVRPSEAAKRLRRKEYPVRKAYAQAEALRDDELRNAIVRLAELDASVKGASRLPDKLLVERALIEITRQHEHSARAGVG